MERGAPHRAAGHHHAHRHHPTRPGHSWGPLINLGTQAISSANLSDGRVLIWASRIRDGFDNNNGITYGLVYNPADGTTVEADNGLHNMYCGGVATLVDGRIIATAGRETSNDTSLFTPAAGTWTAGQHEVAVTGRYYPTTVSLPSGEALTALGTGGNGTASRWNASTGWSTLTGLDLASITGEGPYGAHYPYLHIAPNGLLFHPGPTPNMHYFDWRGNGARYDEGIRNGNDQYRLYGSDALFANGKLLMTGGAPGWTNGTVAAAKTSVEIDINAANGVPVVTQVGSMSKGRYGFNMVDLPNGEVLAVGGNDVDLIFSDAHAVLTPENYNPTSKTWRTVADLTNPRDFHSSALLLKDARVWVAGGAGHTDAQIWTPPYLYNSDGSLATRPNISAAPATINNAAVATVTGTDDITAMTMYKVSATTHGLSTDQRNVPVSFTKTGTGTYRITANSNPYVLVAGDYWLFGSNSAGVPSLGVTVHVNESATLPPPVIPATSGSGSGGIGDLTAVAGGATNMSVSADGTVIAVAPDQRVWKYNGSGWTEILGQPLTRASVRTPAVGQDSPLSVCPSRVWDIFDGQVTSQIFRVQVDSSGWPAGGSGGAVIGQQIGYIRVSSLEQNTVRQLEGVALDRTFADTASGKDISRPQLAAMLSFVREGDTVVVHSMDRLARNLDDLRGTVRLLTNKGVRVQFVKEQLTFTGDDTAMANLLLSVMGAFAEFERALIRDRQREGIELAKKRGAYRGRRPALNPEQIKQLVARSREGVAKAVLAREFGVSRETVYQYLRARDSTLAAVSR